MFGVALELRLADFKKLKNHKLSAILGVCSQFLILPLLTFLLVSIFKPIPSLGLGMILVAACPGGNISNFMSHNAKGNTALSVGLTAFATIIAVFSTPINFGFWGNLNPVTADLLQSISLNPFDMVKAVVLLLLVPLILGMLFNYKFPQIRAKISGPIKKLSILIFFGFVIVAFAGNFEHFLSYIDEVFFLVLIHNGLALLFGYLLGKGFKRPEADCRTLSIETGIQNSGLGLLLIFSFFNGLGGMAMIAAWWGIWHIISGLAVSYFFRSLKIKDS